MITKDSVQQRKNELDQQRIQHLANLHAVLGAIQDCDYWLAKFDEPAPPVDVAPGVIDLVP